MSSTRIEKHDLPEYMTWPELERLPDGVHPLYPTNYLLAGEWTSADQDGVLIDFPFPIRIGRPELAF